MAEPVRTRPTPRSNGAHASGPIILDGDALSRERVPGLTVRAAAIQSGRGRPPQVALIAFADATGRAAYADRKVRVAASAGVAAVPLFLPFGTSTGEALHSMRVLFDGTPLDAVFLEFPFPDRIDGDALVDAIPQALDVDIMTPARIERFTTGADPRPPLTAAAALALIDGYGVDIGGASGLVVGDESPFTLMFGEALVRAGAGACSVVPPAAADLKVRVGEADLVVVAAARPRVLRSSDLATGAVAVDAGYYNAGGVGDIDTSPGIDHLAAYAPVPGGIGPMTISVLIERVIEFAAATATNG